MMQYNSNIKVCSDRPITTYYYLFYMYVSLLYLISMSL